MCARAYRWIQRHGSFEQRHRAIERLECFTLAIQQSARERLVRVDDFRLRQCAGRHRHRTQGTGELADQPILHLENRGQRSVDLH